MAVVKADPGLCQGYANCVVAADDVFDLDDDGVVVVLRDEVEESEKDRVTDAARSCPVSALVVESS
ncbi:ferredoxin [Prauserella marina]|uniref:3-phenylpropionate/trans-cinnamate dioxygenase ferredoxin reductase subunit n=1 Tax=Prauserella marina TaxID=530584 RepID=A0A222VPL4_9PSEU|nr:ferredoxin [Prauserella marina]ASR35693.1 ferredoxin [Prauserella marina]PWV84430.1 3-phenylpropionate/trans-cinnamate dioxygenase ferredoxin reductase subunit [Prauserella marina]SDC22760.1 3-phenylpropionate/trans-cinnamate dioxygenase ferredoxin reductase subunit [Prauserella marina]